MGTSQIQLAGRCLVLSYAGIPTTTISPFGHRHLAWHFYAGWDEVQKFSNKAGNEIATEVEAAALEWIGRNARRESSFAHVHFGIRTLGTAHPRPTAIRSPTILPGHSRPRACLRSSTSRMGCWARAMLV